MQNRLLMVAGPVQIESEILNISSQPQKYMRTEEFSFLMNDILEGLQYIFQTNNPIVCYTSSGTGAMEASVTNFLSEEDSALYVNAGSFGKRWGDILKKHNVLSFELKVPFGKSVEAEDIKRILINNPDIKAIYTTLNETSCGSLHNISKIGEIMKDFPKVLFVVDCISGLCSDEFLMDEWGVDVAISASQKAIALPPGLSFIAVSEKALRFAEKSRLRSFYFDIFDYINNSRRGQTPFTPATCIVEQLHMRLNKIKAEGLVNFQTRYRNNTSYLRKKLQELGFTTFAEQPANCVTGVMTDNINAFSIVERLRQEYNIEIAPSGGELKTKFFRVGNYGHIGNPEIDRFLDALKNVMEGIK